MRTTNPVWPVARLCGSGYKYLVTGVLLLLQGVHLTAQYPPAYTADMITAAVSDPLKKVYLAPVRIVWKSDDSLVTNSDMLLLKGNGQSVSEGRSVCKIINKAGMQSGLLLDFGREICGGVSITTLESNSVIRRIRLRFGESVSEAYAESMNVGKGKDSSTNHHALRDFEQLLPGFGTLEVGNTGFRFLRIDLLDANAQLVLKEVRAISSFRDIPYTGSFRCNDEQLNKIWATGAYTVHLNMQQYLLDGIKRDRSVWAGDIYPELMTINSVFGYNEVVPASLDFLRDHTPLPGFVNGIASYSMWWIIMQHDWYMYQGRMDYLKRQKEYLIGLLDVFTKHVSTHGRQQLDSAGMAFLDWPSFHNKKAVHAGLQALLVIAFEKGAGLCTVLGEEAKAAGYRKLAARMRLYQPAHHNSKQAAALLSLANMMDANAANNLVIAAGGPRHFSAFFGYYMLQAQAKAGDYAGALDNIRKFWGRMLELGATTFWEEFDLEEAANAAPIDDFVPAGKLDYHRNTGAECYTGLRRSLCHGWASGPTPWLTEYVLGIKILEPGSKKIKIEPHLANLEWVEGTFPTPLGTLYVKHVKGIDGKVKTTVKAPKGIAVIQ